MVQHTPPKTSLHACPGAPILTTHLHILSWVSMSKSPLRHAKVLELAPLALMAAIRGTRPSRT